MFPFLQIEKPTFREIKQVPQVGGFEVGSWLGNPDLRDSTATRPPGCCPSTPEAAPSRWLGKQGQMRAGMTRCPGIVPSPWISKTNLSGNTWRTTKLCSQFEQCRLSITLKVAETCKISGSNGVGVGVGWFSSCSLVAPPLAFLPDTYIFSSSPMSPISTHTWITKVDSFIAETSTWGSSPFIMASHVNS